jgi:tetratricopeptide (TPR) repeat protein
MALETEKPARETMPIGGDNELLAGQSVGNGRYKLLQKIGEGGMGEVWLAEQREPVRRRVALKLVKTGMNTREVMARFESERQALALMDHPAIAKVFDAGSTPEGVPYFVMEYVAGAPITTYCDNHRLTTRERLELFMRVCEGVQHAHQKAVIHRDLKPSNILVTEVDGKAAAKIIDFGVAKALTQRLTADTIFTRVGAMIGTPEYMSPEQALSSGEDIDTRTDVYSLGIILYELLAGAPPIELRKIAFEEFLRRLREEEPEKPSTKIRTHDAATSTELARKRQTEPAALAQQVRGDLDSIALKALEKDRSRRYGSPSDLAADVGRHLRNEPVLAVPPSVAYRARKFARRYRAALATAAAFVLVLIVAAGINIRQRIRADSEAAVAQAVNDFLQNDLLAQASSVAQSGRSIKPDPDLKVRTTLDRAAARITGRFDRQPEVEAAIRDTIGQTYLDLGLYPEARKQLERALELEERVMGAEDPKTLKTISRLAHSASLQSKWTEAENLYSQAVRGQRRVLGPEHADTLSSMSTLADVYRWEGKYAQAESLFNQVLPIQRRVLGAEHRDVLYSMSGLGTVYSRQGKYIQAERLQGQILDTELRVWGADDPDTLASSNDLANTYFGEGKYAQAEALYRRAMEASRRVRGIEHPNTLTDVTNLALAYIAEVKCADAEALLSQGLDIERRVLGPEDRDTLSTMGYLASMYVCEGKYVQARALLSRVLEGQSRILGPENPDTLVSMNGLAEVYTFQGQYAQAEALFAQVLAIQRRVLGAEHPNVLHTLSDLGSMYQRRGQYGLADAYTARALAGCRHALGPDNPHTMASAADLALAYVSQGRFVPAEALARESLEFNRKNQPDDWQRYRAESLLGTSWAGQKKYAEAEPLLLEGYQGMLVRKDRIALPDRYHLDRSHEWLVQLYQAWGKPEKAAEWRKK